MPTFKTKLLLLLALLIFSVFVLGVFSINTADAATYQCTSGVCCSGNNYRPSSYECGTFANNISCYEGVGCGDDVGIRYKKRYCSGSSSSCSGEVTDWGNWQVKTPCSSMERCSPGLVYSCEYDVSCDSGGVTPSPESPSPPPEAGQAEPEPEPSPEPEPTPPPVDPCAGSCTVGQTQCDSNPNFLMACVNAIPCPTVISTFCSNGCLAGVCNPTPPSSPSIPKPDEALMGELERLQNEINLAKNDYVTLVLSSNSVDLNEHFLAYWNAENAVTYSLSIDNGTFEDFTGVESPFFTTASELNLSNNTCHTFQAKACDSTGSCNTSKMVYLGVGTGEDCEPEEPEAGLICDLTNAYWSYQSVPEGTEVTLTVEGTNCDGQEINFTIYENDLVLDDLVVTLTGSFPSATWTAEWIADGFLQGDPEYYFIATAGDDSVTSSDSKLEVEEQSFVGTFASVGETVSLANQCLYVYHFKDYETPDEYNKELSEKPKITELYGKIRGPFRDVNQKIIAAEVYKGKIYLIGSSESVFAYSDIRNKGYSEGSSLPGDSLDYKDAGALINLEHLQKLIVPLKDTVDFGNGVKYKFDSATTFFHSKSFAGGTDTMYYLGSQGNKFLIYDSKVGSWSEFDMGDYAYKDYFPFNELTAMFNWGGSIYMIANCGGRYSSDAEIIFESAEANAFFEGIEEYTSSDSFESVSSDFFEEGGSVKIISDLPFDISVVDHPQSQVKVIKLECLDPEAMEFLYGSNTALGFKVNSTWVVNSLDYGKSDDTSFILGNFLEQAGIIHKDAGLDYYLDSSMYEGDYPNSPRIIVSMDIPVEYADIWGVDSDEQTEATVRHENFHVLADVDKDAKKYVDDLDWSDVKDSSLGKTITRNYQHYYSYYNKYNQEASFVNKISQQEINTIVERRLAEEYVAFTVEKMTDLDIVVDPGLKKIVEKLNQWKEDAEKSSGGGGSSDDEDDDYGDANVGGTGNMPVYPDSGDDTTDVDSPAWD